MQLPKELLILIQNGENTEVEFKKSTTDITKDVYDTVCSFSNRDGGHIFLGVKDNGTILGIQPDCIDQIKKNFVTCINNENKMSIPMYADATGESMTATMNRILILRTIRNPFTGFIPESKVPTL